MKIISLAATMLLMTCACAAEIAAEPESPEVSFTFKSGSGEETEAFRGEFTVPENRANPDGRQLTINYVRFASTAANPGAPIVYLAGGPGGSGIETAKGRRFSLFMAMREFGDVIALDQRGTGASDQTPRCRSSVFLPPDQALRDTQYVQLHLDSIAECEAFWKSEGIDLNGYTTLENAADLDDLRAHLGAEKITLWGISYGSHLALTALKTMGERIDRVIIASAEGLDQTVKLPARTDAYFDRLQAAINTDPTAAAMMPDIKALIARVHARVENAPLTISLPQKDGTAIDLVVDRITLQTISSAMIADPQNAVRLIWIYLAMDAGDTAPLAQLLGYFYEPGEPISWSAMSLAMDVASGISNERLALVNEQAKTALLRDYLNFPMPQARGTIGGLDLGEEFRNGPVSDVPTLLFSGTLDGRTYPESQIEATAGLTNLTKVTVINAGHNLFMTSPEVTKTIQAFMRGEAVKDGEIEIALPSLVPGE